MDAGSASAPHFPQAAPIDAYGNGGFRFAGMSHQGSLLCLPDGIWAWPVTSPDERFTFTPYDIYGVPFPDTDQV